MEELNEKVEEVEKRLLMRMEEAKNKGINFVDIGSGRKEELMR